MARQRLSSLVGGKGLVYAWNDDYPVDGEVVGPMRLELKLNVPIVQSLERTRVSRLADIVVSYLVVVNTVTNLPSRSAHAVCTRTLKVPFSSLICSLTRQFRTQLHTKHIPVNLPALE